MKIKNHGLLLLAAALIMSLMSGCGQEDDRTYLPGDSGAGEAASAGTGSASSPEAGSEALDESLALLTDMATTQYFTDEAVDSGDIETILSAGINAPSAMNGQNWHFSAISDRELLTQIAGDMSSGASDGTGASDNSAPAKAGIADAPLAIVVSCSDGSEFDAGLACQAMSSATVLLGYGTKIVSSPTAVLNQSEYRELLGIPEDYSAAAVLLVGYADETVDETADGYTGATGRSEFDSVVTYVDGGV